LELALLIYTGQRRSDIVTMGPQHIEKTAAAMCAGSKPERACKLMNMDSF
jgi:hypothetical protein